MIGRADEQARVWHALADAEAGRGGLLLVVAEAGVGKSRLLREIRVPAAARGVTVVEGRAVEASGRAPLRAIAEAVLGAHRAGARLSDPALGPFGTALARLVPDLAGEQPADREASPLVLAEGVLRLLASLARRAPVLALLEDLHWADDDTLEVVEYLADHLRSSRILCVATVRSGHPSEALTLARALEARRVATVVHLACLGRRDVEAMVAACLEGPAIPELVDFVTRHADGLPLFVEELLADARRSGALVSTGQGWTLDGRLHAQVPEGFAASVHRRLDALGPGPWRVIAAASVLGRHFDWSLLPAMTGLDEPAVLDALRGGVDTHLLVAPGAGQRRFSFRHALTRAAVRARLLEPERAVFARRGLEAVDAHHPRLDGEWCELAAGLATEAGETRRAAALFLDAGRRALARGALATAREDLERARRLAAGDLPLSADVQEALMEVFAHRGEREQAKLAGRSLLRTLDAIGAPAHRYTGVHVGLARAAVAAEDWPFASEQLDLARACGTPGPLAAHLDTLAAHVAIGQGRAGDARVLAQLALDAASERQPGVACEALEVIGRAARLSGVDEAEAAFRRSLAIAQRHGLKIWRARALHEVGTIAFLQAHRPEGLEEALQAAHEAGAVALALNIDGQLAALHGVRLDHDRAAPPAWRAAEAARRLGLASLPIFLIRVALCHALVRDRTQMEAVLAEALSSAGDQAQTAALAWGQCRALCSLLGERRDRALGELEEAMRYTRECATVPPAPFPAVWALARAVESGDRDATAEAATAGLLVPALNRGLVGYARAAAAGHAGDTAAAQAWFASAEHEMAALDPANGHHHLGRRLVAEAAVRDGWGEPAAWLPATAEFFETRGMDRVAGACRALLRRAGVPATRRGRGDAVVPPQLQPLGITSREIDVLGLVAEGLSNREIGERLFVSPRTVSTHVQNLLRKAGLRNRAQLAALATAAHLDRPD